MTKKCFYETNSYNAEKQAGMESNTGLAVEMQVGFVGGRSELPVPISGSGVCCSLPEVANSSEPKLYGQQES